MSLLTSRLGFCGFFGRAFAVTILTLLCSVSARAVTYQYDVTGRLTSIQFDSGTTIEYAYDAASNFSGRRVRRSNYSVSASASPVGAGIVTGLGTFAAGTANISVTASASSGFTFSSWSGFAPCAAQAATCTFTMPAQAVNLVANFVPISTPTFNLTVTAGAAK